MSSQLEAVKSRLHSDLSNRKNSGGEYLRSLGASLAVGEALSTGATGVRRGAGLEEDRPGSVEQC